MTKEEIPIPQKRFDNEDTFVITREVVLIEGIEKEDKEKSIEKKPTKEDKVKEEPTKDSEIRSKEIEKPIKDIEKLTKGEKEPFKSG